MIDISEAFYLLISAILRAPNQNMYRRFSWFFSSMSFLNKRLIDNCSQNSKRVNHIRQRGII